MAYVIASVLVLIALIILGLILRKKVYDDVDDLENWKMDIMNRNVSFELARVKELNLSGETQEKFESWKSRWDHILTQDLPDLEEYLLDAEQAADRFRISLSKKNLQIVEHTLQTIEKDIEQIFIELEQLMESEQNSRQQIEELQPKINEMRNQLIKNRYQYGKAEIRFEVEIDDLKEKINHYYELADSGNYFEAQQLVKQLDHDLTLLSEKIAEFPITYKKCKQELPARIDDLITGIKTMKQDGYRIEHLGFEKELRQYQENIVNCVQQLEKGILTDVYDVIYPMEERIDEMYKLLEKEAMAKSFVENHLPNYQKVLVEMSDELNETKTEVEQLQNTYYFNDHELETHLNLDKSMTQLNQQFLQMDEDLNNASTPHSELRGRIEKGYKALEELQQSHQNYKEQIRALRKDELEAKEKVYAMRQELYNTNWKLQKSNIPGVPTTIWELLDDATEKINVVVEQLEKQPLEMGRVQHTLSEAEKAVEKMIEHTEQILDLADLVELVIQYANRYRSQYAILAAQLAEAENLFRDYEYEDALEVAAKALEEVEPGALQRLEEWNKVPS